METATQKQQIADVIGKPIVLGPWYNAFIAVSHARHSVSCMFLVLGPQGDGILKFKAARLGSVYFWHCNFRVEMSYYTISYSCNFILICLSA
jgi:hypothetical protein